MGERFAERIGTLRRLPHLRPVIGKVLAAIEADDVESRFALRNALPFTVAGVLPARRDRRERLRNVAMPAAYCKQLEHFVPHRGTPSFESGGGQRLPPAHNVRLSPQRRTVKRKITLAPQSVSGFETV